VDGLARGRLQFDNDAVEHEEATEALGGVLIGVWSREVSRVSRGVERGGSDLCFSTKACSG
jgi:hypothetical protein